MPLLGGELHTTAYINRLEERVAALEAEVAKLSKPQSAAAKAEEPEKAEAKQPEPAAPKVEQSQPEAKEPIRQETRRAPEPEKKTSRW